MRIVQRLFLGVSVPAAAIVAVGVQYSHWSEQQLAEAIERDATSRALGLAEDVGRIFDMRVAEVVTFVEDARVREALEASNLHYDVMEDAARHIREIDDSWSPDASVNERLVELESNDLARDMRSHLVSLASPTGESVFVEAFLTNRHGVNVAQTQPTSDFLQNDEAWWKDAWHHGVVFGNVEHDESADTESISLAVRVDASDGRRLGVMKAVLSTAELTDLLVRRANEGDSGEQYLTALVDGAGRTLPAGSAPASEARNAGTEHATYRRPASDGSMRLGARVGLPGDRQVSGSDWEILFELDEDAALAPVRTHRSKVMLLAVVMAIGTTLFGLRFAWSLKRRIQRLDEAYRAVAEGRVDVEVSDPTSDELGRLGQAFLLMARKVRDDAAELERRAEECASAQRMKSQFLANMSHEVRTPLNGIIGMTQMLGEMNLEEQQRDVLDTIETSANALLAVLNDVLDLSKIEDGQLQFEQVPTAPRGLLDGVVEILHVHASSQRTSVEVEVAENVPPFVLGDPNRIRQILLNVIGNAIKFTEDGRVRVSVAVVDDEDAPNLRFEVEDTGVGIPASRIGYLFQSFEQVDSSMTRKHGGTGLGLAISRHLVEGMGGAIGVTSTEGIGSTFWFEIPALWAEANAAGPGSDRAPERRDLSGLQVLVAEDNRVNQRVLAKHLERLEIRVELANNGRLALEAASQQRFDCVLMDCQMPEMDGFEATRAIRELDEPYASTPIVAVTAHAMKEDRQRCFEAGMDDYMTKPIDAESLRLTLEAYACGGHVPPGAEAA